MKWIKQDIYGNEQVWYSQDVIDQIKGYIEDYKSNCDKCTDNRCCSSCFWGSACDLGDEILDTLDNI